jgi:ricin-type beta-trefoil lectin protein
MVRRSPGHRLPSLPALSGLAKATTATVAVASTPAQAVATVALNGGIVGRAFDRVGAIGGGNPHPAVDYPAAGDRARYRGGNSRLLVDSPAAGDRVRCRGRSSRLLVGHPTAGDRGGVLDGRESSRCAGPAGGTMNGIKPTLRYRTGGADQQWAVTPAAQVQISGDRCLEVTGDGGAVRIWDCNGGTNQQWSGDAGDGKCREAGNRARTGGSALVIRSCSGGAHRMWVPGDLVGLRKDAESGRCFDVPAGNQSNGNPPALCNCNSTEDGTEDGTKDGNNAGTNGSNQQWTSRADGRSPDVAADGTVVGIWDYNGGTNQKRTAGNGTEVVVRTCDGAANQKWGRS